MKYGKRMIAISMAVLCVMGFLAACKEENAQKVTFDPPEEERIETETETQMAAEDEILALTGDFRVGVQKDGVSSLASFRDYEQITGVSVEIVEYVSQQDLMEGARAGEFDLIDIYDIGCMQMLGYEGQLLPLDGVLKNYIENEKEYYTNIFEAGRINGELMIAIPYFSLVGMKTSKTVYDAFGDNIDSVQSLRTYYNTLPEVHRAQLKGGFQELRPYLDILIDTNIFTSKGFTENDFNDAGLVFELYDTIGREYETHGYLALPSVFILSAVDFYDDETNRQFYRENEAYDITKGQVNMGAEAIVIPYPGQDDLAIDGFCQGLVKNGKAVEQAAAYLQWAFSEEGQRMYEGRSYGTPGAYQMKLRINKKASEYFIRFMGSGNHDMMDEMVVQSSKRIEKANTVSLERTDLVKSLERAVNTRMWGTDQYNEQLGYHKDDEEYQNVIWFEKAVVEAGLIENRERRKLQSFDDWGDYLQKVLRLYYQNMGYVPQ